MILRRIRKIKRDTPKAKKQRAQDLNFAGQVFVLKFNNEQNANASTAAL
jgi:hypothetical protein